MNETSEVSAASNDNANNWNNAEDDMPNLEQESNDAID